MDLQNNVQCHSWSDSSLADSGPEYLSKVLPILNHLDNSVRPVTTAFFVYTLSKQTPLVKEPFDMQVLWSGTNFHMTSEFTIKSLIQKGPLNLSLCRALLNHRLFYPVLHRYRSLSIVCFLLLLFRLYAPFLQ